MKRLLDNLHVDLIAAALMVAMVATGYILRFPLPPGTNKTMSLWGLTRHQWGTVHFWISNCLLALVVMHVCLHWQWIIVTVKRRLGRNTSPSKSPLVSGLTTAVVIAAALALFGWTAHLGVRPITEPIECVHHPEDESASIGASHRPVQASPDFVEDVYPIFERRCSSCHGPKKQMNNFRVDRRDALFEGTTPLVVPGDSDRSPLVDILLGNRIRADVHRLPSRELETVKKWIDAGADWPDSTTN
jgi:hypothetical protein